MSAGVGPFSRWLAFVRERYGPTTHVAMAAAFALGNAGAAGAVQGATPNIGKFLLSGVLVAVFFFRLRVCDEIKDYDTDLSANPQRPLPRGLISLGEARRAVWLLALAEMALASFAGLAGVSAWALAYLYSLAMYAEFGVGEWLRPKMELYAVTHTVVASLLGLTVCSIALGLPLTALPARLWVMAPANWALFNIFEFSRKTFAPSEELPDVDSYSSRWGVQGAAVITLFWVGSGLACLWAAGIEITPLLPGIDAAVLFGCGAIAVAAPYSLRPSPRLASLLRVSMSAWAALLYVLVGINGLKGV